MDRFTEERKETIVSTCGFLGVSRQVYYRRKRSKAKNREKARTAVNLVLSVRRKMPRLGVRKLHYILQEPLKKLNVGRDKLFSILKANHLCVKPQRSYHITTNSHHRFRKHKNLILGMDIVRPEQVWVSDITYIGSRNCHNYLALVTDAYSKKIVGYNLSNNLGTDGALKALKMAIKGRKYKENQLMHHSDRGIQYCSESYQTLLSKNKIKPSMTESYDPYANAVAERVNGIIKGEFELEKYAFKNEVLKVLVKDSVETYNRSRPHFSCYLMTPEQMHNQQNIIIKTYKNNTASKVNFAGC